MATLLLNSGLGFRAVVLVSRQASHRSKKGQILIMIFLKGLALYAMYILKLRIGG
jgi:hypothetical protein